MTNTNKEIINENLTQKDIVQLLLHNAQHMVTREELKIDIKELRDELKADILKVESNMSKVEANLKADISKVEDKISKVDSKFDKIQWLIIATMMTVLLKDYIFNFLGVNP